MRLMLDTNIFIYYAIDRDLLTDNVCQLLLDYENQRLISMESVKELIVAYRVKRLLSNRWDSPVKMIESIVEDFGIQILPVDINVMRTYANLQLNMAQDHKDPSDHVIISHAITLGIPLISSDHKFAYYRKQGLDLIENF